MQTRRRDGPGSERDQARFYAKVALPNEQGCMLWMGALNWRGYGRFSLGGNDVRAHRFAYVLAYGEVPDRMVIDHLCRVRHCVAPLHLEAVSPRENLLRGDTLAAHNARKTHCPQGHPYDDANTYIAPSGDRQCRACRPSGAQNRKRRRKCKH